MSGPAARWWRDARALAWPAGGYWGAMLVSMGLFSGLVLLLDGLSDSNLFVLGSLWAAAVLGVGFGQACALTRLRLPVVLAAGGVVSVGLFFATGVTVLSAGPVGLFFAVLWLLFPFFAVSGLLSLRTSAFQVFALFSPMVWIVASILLVSESTGAADRWFAGQKWAIWDAFTAPILALGIALALVWMASREIHRLHRWSTADQGPADAHVRRVTGDVVRASVGGCGTLFVAAGLVVVLSTGTGLLAPYLWRSHPVDDDGDRRARTRPADGNEDPATPQVGDGSDARRPPDGNGAEGDPGAGSNADGGERTGKRRGKGKGRRTGTGTGGRPGDGSAGDGSAGAGGGGGDERAGAGANRGGAEAGGTGGAPRDGAGGPEDLAGGGPGDGASGSDATAGDRSPSGTEPLEEAVRSTGISLFFLVLMVALALLALAVFGPPVRRSVVLAVLRRPFGRPPPSDRVRDAWRVAEIALGDLGVARLPGDSATALARRALPLLPTGLNTEPILETAAVADRAAFGLGLDPLDESQARRHAEMAYQAVWDTLSERAKLAAIYRWDL